MVNICNSSPSFIMRFTNLKAVDSAHTNSRNLSSSKFGYCHKHKVIIQIFIPIKSFDSPSFRVRFLFIFNSHI